MKYEIIDFNENVGQIVVEFNDSMSMSIDLPINELGLYPIGDELKEVIEAYYPQWYFDRIEQISSGIANVNSIKVLVKEKVINVEQPIDTIFEESNVTISEQEAMQQEAFEEIVINILKSRGIIDA